MFNNSLSTRHLIQIGIFFLHLFIGGLKGDEHDPLLPLKHRDTLCVILEKILIILHTDVS